MSEVLSAQLVIAFQVLANTDMTEGRGQDISIGTYLTREEADARAKGNGVYGSDATVKPVQAVKFHTGEAFVLGEQIEKGEEIIEKERKRVIAKLTPYERNLLGIKE